MNRRCYGMSIGFYGGPFEVDFRLMPDGPKLTKKRLHLDVKLVRGSQNWFVLADPEGNEFCLFATFALAGATGIVRRIDPS